MNTNSYYVWNDDTWGITPLTLLAFTLSLVLGTKSLFAQSAVSGSDRLPIEVISGESPFVENAQWQQLSSGHAGCEGAQWEIRNDILTLMYAAHHDQLAHRWTEASGLTVWRDDSPAATSFRPDGKGGYYVVEQTTRQLARWDANGKRVAILADRFDGKRLNRPNDCVVHSDGSVWFTDPNFLFRVRPNELQELDGQFVFRFDPKDSSLRKVVSGLKLPNGIAFSPDEKWLFVTDSASNNLYRWPIESDKALGKREVFATLAGAGNDGIAFDPKGRLWCCTKGGVVILSPSAETLAVIKTPNKPTSIAFAPTPSRMVCITTRDACYVTELASAESSSPASVGMAFAERNETSEQLFVRRIAPLLREKCLACHGDDVEAREGGLDLRSLQTVAGGGGSEEPGVVPMHPERSSVYLAATRSDDAFSAMPPKESESLAEEEVRWLHDWIATGAVWPTEKDQTAIRAKHEAEWSQEDGVRVRTSGGLSDSWTNRNYDPEGLWAYQPLLKSAVPSSHNNPIDGFLQAALPKGLQVAPPASRPDLIRRATFDLTGLPPTPDEVKAFLNEKREDKEAFQDVVERLLASPHYGERMAQHWLDVVRYADSSGFANDFERGNAWRYRDYVIRAFQGDKPYDQFVREQIAGDEISPHNPEGLVAVGFLRQGPWELTSMEVPKVARQRFLDDVTNSVGETFLAHSLQCAKCHDHKFDPVPTRDYYSIQAIFNTTQLAERQADFLPLENQDGFEEERFLEKMEQGYRESLAALESVLQHNALAWFDAQLEEAGPGRKQVIRDSKSKWMKAVSKAKKNKKSIAFQKIRSGLMQQGIAQSDLPPSRVGFTPRQNGMQRVATKGLQRLKWEFDRYKPFALSVYSGSTPTYIKVLAPLRMPKGPAKGSVEQMYIRTDGDPFAEGDPVKPGVLSVLEGEVPAVIPETPDGRRKAFAEWITDSNNPLVSRVMVNRIWQWHFGKAIAGNPNNFGLTGGFPTHPKLLDYLATTFMKSGWSVKDMHRKIMLSEAYRRSSTHPDPDTFADQDPEGRSFAVFEPRRLSAEEMRDSMLAITGELNCDVGGVPCRPEINEEVALQPRQVMGAFASAWVPNPKSEQRHRRSLYILKLRGVKHPMLEVFNTPAPDFSCERRESSTVTPQALNLFNSKNSYDRSLALAQRAWEESSGETGNRDLRALRRIYELVLCREPQPEELDQALQSWGSLEASLPAEARPDSKVPLTASREAVEELSGERFMYDEVLYANQEFESDLQPNDVDRHVRALGDICLVFLNTNEFVYVY
jgi:sugar lactone lactonase YvrE